MSRVLDRLRRVGGVLQRRVEGFANGFKFGFVFVRARWFKMPRRVRIAGRRIELHYPPEIGVETDFISCFVRNDYGLRRRIQEVRTILDIGANVGFFSLAAKGYYPYATIHAYEPNPRILPFLRANVSELEIGVYDEAVGSRDGFTNMVDNGPSNQARTCTGEDGEIRVVSLDKAIQRLGGWVDLLKLDCEGAEWDLFQIRDCWQRIGNVRMEYHLFHGETFQQVADALRSLGFAVIRTQHDVGFGIAWATQLQQPR
jgi:FkbM family methyltransferase